MFLRTESGDFINADEVVRVHLLARGVDRPERWFVVTRDGERQELDYGEQWKFEVHGLLVPARPGDSAVTLTIWIDGAQVDHHVQVEPIVAWRMVGERSAVPVFADEPSANVIVGIILPGGAVLLPGDRIYATQEEFITEQVAFHVKLKRQSAREVALTAIPGAEP